MVRVEITIRKSIKINLKNGTSRTMTGAKG